MSALAGSTAEVATGSRKKTKKVNKATRKDDIAERARQQLETLQLRPPLTNGTNDHGIAVPVDHACTPTLEAPKEFGGPQIPERQDVTPTIAAPKEFGDSQVLKNLGEVVGTLTLEPPFGFGGTQIPSSPSELERNKILNTPVGTCGSVVSMEFSEDTAGPSDNISCMQMPSILKLTAHSDHCKEGCCGQKMHLLENLEEALVSLETALEEQRAAVRQDPVEFVSYESELQMAEIMRLIQNDLSEPYSIYTYRYFIHNWPKLCFLAMVDGHCIGAVVCKLDLHRNVKRGYIAMLAVDEKYRKRKIGSRLVRQAIQAMIQDNADEVVLETEITNKPALRLYENLGFVRDKRLFRYYLNGVDALRLKLWLR